jgi:hypothetical protein
MRSSRTVASSGTTAEERSGASARRGRRRARGIVLGLLLSLCLFLPAALLLAFSLLSTMEAESPEEFPGLRDNYSDVALITLQMGVVPAVILGAVAFAIRRSHRVVSVVGAVMCGLLLMVAAYRTYTLMPMLECSGYNAVAQEDDGSYSCYDR